MRNPIKAYGRQVSIKMDQKAEAPRNVIDRMKTRIDSDHGRHMYSKRLGTVEPVFGNINTKKRLNRLALRGKTKVNAQWLLFCLVHNIEKIQRYG